MAASWPSARTCLRRSGGSLDPFLRNAPNLKKQPKNKSPDQRPGRTFLHPQKYPSECQQERVDAAIGLFSDLVCS